MNNIWIKILLLGIIGEALIFAAPHFVYAAPVSLDPNYSVSLLTSGLSGPANGVIFRSATNDLLVSEFRGNRVSRIDAATGAVSLFAFVETPDEMAINSKGEVFVKTHRPSGPINRFDSNGNFLGSFSPFPDFPTGIAFDKDDNLYVANNATGTIWKFTKDTFTSPIVFASGFPSLEGIAFSPSDQLFAADHQNGRAYQVTPGGTTLASHILWASNLFVPLNFAFDPITGNVFVSNSKDIVSMSAPGVATTFASGFEAFGPTVYDLDFDIVGNLYVDSFTQGEVWKFTRKGTRPAPFLDLPWDYEGKGLSFNEAALNPFSWFDHQYPLQNECCERIVKIYTGKTINEPYRSHNGYDYSLKNGVELNTPVLAAASGIATFKSAEHSGGAGNIIKIDHGNGYQTWYEHLSNNDLIVSTEGVNVSVAKGQMIGRVGMTGNTSGPHIHFSVFKDANNNSTFDDDYPYGVVDPLGWEGEYTDPWTEWSDGIRTGTESFNLFIPRIAPKSMSIPTTGDTLIMDAVQIAVPSGALSTDFTLTIKNGPFEFVSDTLKSIVPSFFLDAVDTLNQKVTEFLQPIQITYIYEEADLFNINEDTLKLYFFNDRTSQWEALSSILDKDNRTITAETTHFSQFALMGEVKDNIPPTTDVAIHGDKGEDNWYRSTVSIDLNGIDNDEGVGLQYTLYTIDGNDWLEYKTPLVFENEGTYSITYQSIDKGENTEDRTTITFHIDKIPPLVSIDASPKEIWPPNGKMVDVTVTGSATDDHLYSNAITVEDEYNFVEPTISDFGQTIQLEARKEGSDKDGRMYIVKGVAEDLAGNITEKQTQVIVPHDQGKKKK